MKHLFVIRHGHYDRNLDLSDYGKSQITGLAQQMKEITGELQNGFYLLSSTAPRAFQTAQIIADSFGLDDFDSDEEIYTEGGYLPPEILAKLDAVVTTQRKHDAIAITTHYEVVGGYPSHFLKSEFGRTEHIRRPEKGEAVHFDIEKQTYQLLR